MSLQVSSLWEKTFRSGGWVKCIVILENGTGVESAGETTGNHVTGWCPTRSPVFRSYRIPAQSAHACRTEGRKLDCIFMRSSVHSVAVAGFPTSSEA